MIENNTFLLKTLAGFTCLLLLSISSCIQAAPVDGKQFKNWTTRCVQQESKSSENKKDENKNCFIIQNLALKDSNQFLLNLTVGYLFGEEQPSMIVRTPLGVILPAGISIAIDENDPTSIIYTQCDKAGCIAPMKISNDMLKSLKKGTEAKVSYNIDRKYTIPTSLAGFTAAFNSLK